MSYVKTNWKNGDVITAEKLNNLENGASDKGYEIEKLISDIFSGSIVAQESGQEGVDVFVASIDLEEDLPAVPDKLIVVYDNVEYAAERIIIGDIGGGSYYGANMDESGMPDFSEYPFCCFIPSDSMSLIELATETSGSHFVNIKSAQETIIVSSDFSNAVNQSVEKSVLDVKINVAMDGNITKILNASNDPEFVCNILDEGKNVRILMYKDPSSYTVFYLHGYHTGTIDNMDAFGYRFYSLPVVENGEIIAGGWIDVAQVTTRSGYSYHYIANDSVSSAYPTIWK